MVGDRFELLEPLGRGGFCTVYRARMIGPEGFSRAVAVKLLNPDVPDTASALKRLRDEARILSRLRHPAIVSVDRLVQVDGRWAVVMELLHGRTLTAALAEGPLPTAVALQVTALLAGALAEGWQTTDEDGTPLRLLHRDIKPDNILLTEQGGVRLLDFGIARAAITGRESATTTVLYGTPAYTAPERYDGQELPAGDVYSLGCVLYEMLVGEPVGRTSANPAVHEDIWGQAIERIALLGVEDALVLLLSEMLAAAPTDRPSAAAVAARCDAMLHPGGGLLSWSAMQPAVRPISPLSTDDLPTLSPPRSPPRSPLRPLLAGALIIGLAGAVVMQREAPTPTAAPVEEPAVPAVVTPSAAPAVQPEPEAIAEPSAIVPPAEPAVQPEPPAAAPPAAAPPSEPAPPLAAQVSTSGPATWVELRAADQRITLPGKAPPGTYTIWARFEGSPAARCGTVTLAADQTITVHTDPVFASCEAR